METTISRRRFAGGIVSIMSLASAGCGWPAQGPTTERRGSQSGQPARPIAPVSVKTYRDPSCGCCEQWARRAREAGYRVTVTDHSDMPAIKRELGVPEELSSCHTSVAGGYVFEGHVPLDDVKRALAERPAGIKGLAVPGMPRGSPGMEMPDGAVDPFKVMAFDSDGKVSIFRG